MTRVSQLTDGGEVVGLTPPPRKIYSTDFCQRLGPHMGRSATERTPLISSRIEPATFWVIPHAARFSLHAHKLLAV
jgi:hypothetical protein